MAFAILIHSIPELLYYIGYFLDRRLKLKRQKRLPHPVISIGNITVGGTGKTPAVIAIAEEAKKRGFYPIVLTRGYKGKAKGPCIVLARKLESSEVKDFHSSALPRFCSSALEAGDEPVLMAERLKDVPIVKCADRYEGGMFALQSLSANSPILFILDDGFQHYKLYRDKDIVLIDGTNPFGSRKLLPSGTLREPLNALKRADVFVITKAKNKQLPEELKSINPSASVYFSQYKTVKVINSKGEEFAVEMLRDKKVFAFCGIANPESFKMTVEKLCKGITGFKAYRDHHCYDDKDMAYIQEQKQLTGSDYIITTEKDMVKIRGLSSKKNMLHIKISFDVDKEFFNCIFADIYR
jgi:tetraacyldisaccharide 4'-kinase